MATVPNPLLGRHLTYFQITPQSVADNGTLSDGSSVNLLAQLDGSALQGQPEHEEINAMNTTRRNMVVISEGDTLSINIFKVNNGNNPNPLFAIWNSYDYFKVIWHEGTATGSIQTCTYYGVRGDLDTSIQGRGKQIASLSLLPADIGSAQFTISIS